MKTDAQLEQDVLDEMEWDPAINAAHVGVIAKDGVVTLTGHLDTYAEKLRLIASCGTPMVSRQSRSNST